MGKPEYLPPEALAALYDGYREAGSGRFPERFQKELTEVCAAAYRISLRNGGDAIDLGANHGFHTLRMRRSIGQAGGRVIAVEGNPYLAERLRALVAHDSRVIVLHMAVVATPAASVTFTISKKYKALGSVMDNYIQDRFPQLHADAELETHVVQAMTLDQIITTYNIDKLRFLKCDVEGTDFQVMNSANLMFHARASGCFEMNFGPAAKKESPKLLEKILHNNYHVYDCFMNRLNAATWYEPSQCPIDRFLFPAETAAETLAEIAAAVQARWAAYGAATGVDKAQPE